MGNLTLKELGRRAFETAKAKGFHDEPIDIPRALMLTVSELAEALEADRKNKRANVEAFGRWDATFRCIEEGNRQNALYRILKHSSKTRSKTNWPTRPFVCSICPRHSASTLKRTSC